MVQWKTIREFVKIGRTGKKHGTQGEVKLHMSDEFAEDCVRHGFLFLDLEGNKVPFPILNLRFSRGLLVQLADNATEAETCVARDVYLPTDAVSVRHTEVDELEYGGLRGYLMVDTERGEVGEIADVRLFPQQEMAVIEIEGQEKLIPLNQTFIQNIDHERGVVRVELPEGLLDL